MEIAKDYGCGRGSLAHWRTALKTGLVSSICRVLGRRMIAVIALRGFLSSPKCYNVLLELLSRICEAKGLLPYYSNGTRK